MQRLLCVLITLTICMAAVTVPASAAVVVENVPVFDGGTISTVPSYGNATSYAFEIHNRYLSFTAFANRGASALAFSFTTTVTGGSFNPGSYSAVSSVVVTGLRYALVNNPDATGTGGPVTVRVSIPGFGVYSATVQVPVSQSTVSVSLSRSGDYSASSPPVFYVNSPQVNGSAWRLGCSGVEINMLAPDPPNPLPSPDSGTPQFAIPFSLSGDATQLPDARQYVNAIFQQAILNKWWSFAEYPYYTITHWYVEGAPYQYLVIVLSHDPYEGTVSLQTGGALQFDEWHAQGSEMIYVLPYLADDPSTLLSGTLYYSMWYYPHWNWLDYVNGRVSDWMGGYSGSGECIAGARVRTATVNTTGPLSFYGISNYLVYDSIPVDGQYMSNSGWFSSTQIPEAYMDLFALWVGSGSSNSVDHEKILEKLTSIDGNVKDIEDLLNASDSYSSDATTAIKDAAASAGEFLENNADMSLVINDLSTHKPVIDDLFSQFFAAMGLEATIILSLMVLGVIGILLQRR